MGTNFYLRILGQEDDYHIGKRSRGFRFLWDFQGCKTVKVFENFLLMGTVYDENGKMWLSERFMGMAKNWCLNGTVDLNNNFMMGDYLVSKHLNWS